MRAWGFEVGDQCHYLSRFGDEPELVLAEMLRVEPGRLPMVRLLESADGLPPGAELVAGPDELSLPSAVDLLAELAADSS